VELLFDADATINLRSIGMLEVFLGSDVELIWTSYVFENELCDLQRELGPLRASGQIQVAALSVRTPAHQAFQDLKRQGVDKGEAEAIAWSRSTPTMSRRFFVSDDKRARKTANGDPPAISSAECVALMVLSDKLREDEAQELLGVWDDEGQRQGRPRGWKSVEQDFQKLLDKVRDTFDL